MDTDVLIIGCGCSGLYCALQLPKERKITIITKSDLESSDSFLAQGGICMLRNDADYEDYFEDTMRAGHYENDKRSVDIMIRSSQDVVKDLLEYGVDFQRDASGALAFTKEGAHSEKRILYHEDITGKEITSTLLEQVKRRSNITLVEYTTMVDILEKDNRCYGAIVRKKGSEDLETIMADYTIFATGGVGGLYRHSTNFRHLTGDALAVAIRHKIDLKNINYVQIHPTTFYTENKEDRSFLISESVRGEGAKLLDKNGKRFVNELLPRDVVTEAIHRQMEQDQTSHVWEDLRGIPEEELTTHFPNIVQHCKEMGFDVTKECIPVVPAQHYFMGGIKVNYSSKTSMGHLYAVGETACNGVHGKNRLASNSLLESLVFAKRAATDMTIRYREVEVPEDVCKEAVKVNEEGSLYKDETALEELYAKLVHEEMRKADELAEAEKETESISA